MLVLVAAAAAASRGGERRKQGDERGAASHRPEDTGCVVPRLPEPAYGFGRQAIAAAPTGQVISDRGPTTRWNSSLDAVRGHDPLAVG